MRRMEICYVDGETRTVTTDANPFEVTFHTWKDEIIRISHVRFFHGDVEVGTVYFEHLAY